jgi:hypothetical protein
MMFGYSLFGPRSDELIKVGAGGYFDEYSNWTRIGDVTTVVDDEGNALQSMNGKYLIPDKPATLGWGAKYSSSVAGASQWWSHVNMPDHRHGLFLLTPAVYRATRCYLNANTSSMLKPPRWYSFGSEGVRNVYKQNGIWC